MMRLVPSWLVGRPVVCALPLLAIAALRAPGASAQQAAPDSAVTRRGRTHLDSLVVSAPAPRRPRGYVAPSADALKTPTPLRDEPQSVTLVTRKLILDQSMQGMADVVRYVPGITMGQGEGHRDAPIIRGNITTSGFFLDGLRDDVQYMRDLYNVERVEAVKGANALLFGRGVGGGIINRVTKTADFAPVRELTLQGGSYDNRRAAIDVGQGLTGTLAGRLNAVYENSDQFRRDVNVERYGIAPTASLLLGGHTRLSAALERFSDRRTVDRGLPSLGGLPYAGDIRTFYGDPDQNRGTLTATSANLGLEHALADGVTFRQRAGVGVYDKFYQNLLPGAVNASAAQVSLSGYNATTGRTNAFSQSELTAIARTGRLRHTLLAGAEAGRQVSTNFRNTGYFGNTAATLSVPLDAPTVATPVTWRQSATDADNRTRVTTLALYAQDQLALTPAVQLLGGVRYERFDLQVDDHRTGAQLARVDNLISPRAGLVVKPVEPVSVYGSLGVGYLPSSGDQFASLTPTTSTLVPERFTNYEVGAKVELVTGLALTAAAYQLDRTNTTAPDPSDPTRLVQTGSQRSKGLEFGAMGRLTGAWELAAGYALQDAFISSRTAAAAPGQKVPLVPRHALSLWNRYQLAPAVGVGLGVTYRSDMFAAIDNSVTLPGYTRVDAAVFLRITPLMRAQVNVENLFDVRYYATSQGNNNIAPGSIRAVRATLIAGF